LTTISVCLATFNGASYVREQVESILPQLAPSDEFIVSDNGSTDGTLEYLRSLDCPHLRLHLFTERMGPVANFENALRCAQGAVIVLADQDDVWLPNRLDRVRMAFPPGLSVPLCLVSEGDRIDGAGLSIARSNLEALRFRPGLWANLVKNSFMGCTMAFRHELLRLALPFPAGIPMHDSWLGILAGCVGTIAVDHQASYRYRVHGANLSHRQRPVAAKVRDRLVMALALASRLTSAFLHSRLGWDRS
jgi:glycosyltransferase involved in cell wall biosynthesis